MICVMCCVCGIYMYVYMTYICVQKLQRCRRRNKHGNLEDELIIQGVVEPHCTVITSVQVVEPHRTKWEAMCTHISAM